MRHLDLCTCGGVMRQYTTKTKGRIRTRYLKCDRCKTRDVERFYVDKQGRPVFAPCVTLLDTDAVATSSTDLSIEVTTIAKGNNGQTATNLAQH